VRATYFVFFEIYLFCNIVKNQEMILVITKLELKSYSKFKAFFKFNTQIITELQSSKCKKYKVTGNWTLKVWYTMTLWENEDDLNTFYSNGTHLEAMKQSKSFSSNIQSIKVPTENEHLMSWKQSKIVLLRSTKTKINKL
jgi:hypothetical protein